MLLKKSKISHYTSFLACGAFWIRISGFPVIDVCLINSNKNIADMGHFQPKLVSVYYPLCPMALIRKIESFKYAAVFFVFPVA